MSKGGIKMDLDKVQAVLGALTPHNAKVLTRFLQQIKGHIAIWQTV
jgi:hypothetical protein